MQSPDLREQKPVNIQRDKDGRDEQKSNVNFVPAREMKDDLALKPKDNKRQPIEEEKEAAKIAIPEEQRSDHPQVPKQGHDLRPACLNSEKSIKVAEVDGNHSKSIKTSGNRSNRNKL